MESYNLSRRRLQLFFVLAGAIFVLFLVIRAVLSSAARRDVLSTSAVEETSDASGQSIQLQEFHRVYTRGGRTEWEVWAKELIYSPTQQVINLNEMTLHYFKRKDSIVKISAKRARLISEQTALKDADLEGEVTVVMPDGMTLKTERAHYDATEQLVTSGEPSLIEGLGYRISGVGLNLQVKEEIGELLADVYSDFSEQPK